MSAMDEESDQIEEALCDARRAHAGNYRYVHGYIEGYPVVAATCVGGMSNAAVATTLALVKFAPICVVVQGVAGAHDVWLRCGDVVLGERLVNYGAYEAQRRPEGAGSDPLTWLRAERNSEVTSFDPNHALKSDARLLDIAEQVPYLHGAVFRGTIGSSDGWTREVDLIKRLNDTMGTACEEMESYPAATACEAMGVPMLALRAISNNALHEDDAYDENAASYVQEFTLAFVRQLVASFRFGIS